ncbi:podocalyxin [Eumetopias jubatus]|uniref:podocalyxin n=1 Tax=Eumetopias jubatus TaxID=34886 RepID=UPI0010163E67|nr:podocalyxin [Eumetopias jubatus]
MSLLRPLQGDVLGSWGEGGRGDLGGLALWWHVETVKDDKTRSDPAITTKPATPNAPILAPAAGEVGGATDQTTASAVPRQTEKRVTAVATRGIPPTVPGSSGPTLAPGGQSTAVVPTDEVAKASSEPSVASDGTKEPQGLNKTTLGPPAKFMQPETVKSQTAGAQGSPGVTTSYMTTEGQKQATSPSPDRVSTLSPASALPLSSAPTGPHKPSTNPATSKPPGSPPEGPSKIPTVAPSSLGTKAGPSSTLYGTPTTPPSLVTLEGNLQKSSMMPAVTGTSSPATGTSSPATGTSSPTTGTPSSATGTPSVPGTSSSEAPQPAGPSSGPVATSPVEGSRSPSTQLASTAPRVSNIPPPSSAHGDDRIKCESPERLTDKMLILNLTKTSLCAGNSSSDDKLVTLLCRAAKAAFNPAQDKCHIRLVPIQDSQAVAVKEIAVQTKLLPRDAYDSLKDKWDELKEVGVSNMKFGNQGPPEETEDRFSMPLIITIVCMASFLLLVAALYGCCHQRLSQRKDQQRLTEELQTVENGYHDNPTLEVMETSSEMQEKKVVNLNGELGDSWIVPLDNLAKDDLDEEEDTHL